MRFSLKCLWVCTALVVSGSAHAFFDAQALVGKRSYTLKNNGTSSTIGATEVKLAAHLSPIPLVPIAVGAGLSTLSFENKGERENYQAMTGGLELLAWIPTPISITPYARLNYILFGALKGDVKDSPTSSLTWKISGLHMAIGVRYSLIPLVSLLAEYDLGSSDTFKADSVTVNGVTVADKSSMDMTGSSNAILIGAEIGL